MKGERTAGRWLGWLLAAIVALVLAAAGFLVGLGLRIF